MPATLTKIQNGKPPISDTLPNEQTLKCPRCEQTYRLAYSDNEWNKVKDWLKLAQVAIRQDHDSRHEATTIQLEWKGIRGSHHAQINTLLKPTARNSTPRFPTTI